MGRHYMDRSSSMLHNKLSPLENMPRVPIPTRVGIKQRELEAHPITGFLTYSMKLISDLLQRDSPELQAALYYEGLPVTIA